MSENGLTRFAVHSTDLRDGRAVAAIAEEVAGKGRTRSVDADPGRLDPRARRVAISPG